MTFKIRSEAIHTDWPYGPTRPGVPTIVLVREKILRNGNVLCLKGVVATDEEGKTGDRIPATARIRVIDDDHLGIVFKRRGLSSVLWELASGKKGYFDREERVIHGRHLPDGLETGLTSIVSHIPKVFSRKDMRMIKSQRRSGTLEFSSELIYEPVLPSQSRK